MAPADLRDATWSVEELELGISDFNRCLELNPVHVTAFLYRGFLYFKMGTRADPSERQAWYDKAMVDYKHALELDPENRHAKRMLQQMDGGK